MRCICRKRGVQAGFALVLLLSVALGARAFPGWWQDRLVKKAELYLSRGDTRGAFLSAHEALNRDPACVPALELMAQVNQRSHSPEEIFWRERLVALQPRDATRQVQLAEAALRYGETFAAKHALELIPVEEQTFRYHQAEAELALSTGQLRLAQDHLEAANRLQPDDGGTQLMLEKVRLAAPEPEARALAHERMQGFTSDSSLRLEACRVLLSEARAQGKWDEAKQVAQDIHNLPEASFTDRLAYLEELERAKERTPTEEWHLLSFENELNRRKAEASSDGASIFALASWLNSRGYADKTSAWLGEVPEPHKSLPSTKLVETEASAMLKDWAKVEKLVSGESWGRIEHLRLAFLARASLARKDSRESDVSQIWENARRAAGTDREKIKTLASLAESWGWTSEPEKLWWELAANANGSLAALQHLFALCRKRGATEELLRISERIYRLDQSDAVARNNFAQLSMLLGHGSPETQNIARENAGQHPEDWAVNSTYAFSLHLQGRDQEAIELMLRLPGQPQRDPQMAVYFGVLYAAVGQSERARPLLERALAAELLPEETNLVRAALAQ